MIRILNRMWQTTCFLQPSLLKSIQSLHLQQQFSFAVRNLSLQEPYRKWKVVKGDKVIIRSGRDKGKSGTVIRVYRKTNEVLVQGINLKFVRIKTKDDENQQGGIKQKAKPVHISKVALIDPESGKATKVSFGFTEDGKRVRVAKKSGSIVEKAMDPALSKKVRHKNKQDGVKDTVPSLVSEITYHGEDFDAIKKQFIADIAEKERKEKLLIFSL